MKAIYQYYEPKDAIRALSIRQDIATLKEQHKTDKVYCISGLNTGRLETYRPLGECFINRLNDEVYLIVK